MSFSSRVKEELSYQTGSAMHCRIAEIGAILSMCGKIFVDDKGEFSVKIHTENLAVARKYFTLVKKTAKAVHIPSRYVMITHRERF